MILNELILKRVIATILKVDPAILDETSSMDNISNWDSLRHMNLILSLEEEFKVIIPDEDAGSITSYKLIKFVLEGLLKSQG
jgi:acyl carrier protein